MTDYQAKRGTIMGIDCSHTSCEYEPFLISCPRGVGSEGIEKPAYNETMVILLKGRLSTGKRDKQDAREMTQCLTPCHALIGSRVERGRFLVFCR